MNRECCTTKQEIHSHLRASLWHSIVLPRGSCTQGWGQDVVQRNWCVPRLILGSAMAPSLQSCKASKPSLNECSSGMEPIQHCPLHIPHIAGGKDIDAYSGYCWCWNCMLKLLANSQVLVWGLLTINLCCRYKIGILKPAEPDECCMTSPQARWMVWVWPHGLESAHWPFLPSTPSPLDRGQTDSV